MTVYGWWVGIGSIWHPTRGFIWLGTLGALVPHLTKEDG